MIVNYTVEEKDFLTYQLYVASKSDRIKKKRKRSKIVVPFIYLFFSFFAFLEEKYVIMFVFFSIGLLWLILYPIWQRRHYIKHYEAFIKENYKDRLHKNTTVEFTNDFIFAKDEGSESKIMTKEIDEIVEIPSTIFIRLKGGQSLILPLDKIENRDALKIDLKELATYLNITYDFDEKWEWK